MVEAMEKSKARLVYPDRMIQVLRAHTGKVPKGFLRTEVWGGKKVSNTMFYSTVTRARANLGALERIRYSKGMYEILPNTDSIDSTPVPQTDLKSTAYSPQVLAIESAKIGLNSAEAIPAANSQPWVEEPKKSSLDYAQDYFQGLGEQPRQFLDVMSVFTVRDITDRLLKVGKQRPFETVLPSQLAPAIPHLDSSGLSLEDQQRMIENIIQALLFIGRFDLKKSGQNIHKPELEYLPNYGILIEAVEQTFRYMSAYQQQEQSKPVDSQINVGLFKVVEAFLHYARAHQVYSRP